MPSASFFHSAFFFLFGSPLFFLFLSSSPIRISLLFLFWLPLFSHSLSYCCGSSPEQDQRGFSKQKQVDHQQCQEEEQAMTEQLHVQSAAASVTLSFFHGQHGRVIYLPPSPLILVGIFFILTFLSLFFLLHLRPPSSPFFSVFSFWFFYPFCSFSWLPLKHGERMVVSPTMSPGPLPFIYIYLNLTVLFNFE